jgi:hypothetical protein
VIGWPHAGGEHPFLKGCGDGGVLVLADDEGRECMPQVRSAAWSTTQELLLVATDEVLLVDPGADTMRSLGSGVAPRWAP